MRAGVAEKAATVAGKATRWLLKLILSIAIGIVIGCYLAVAWIDELTGGDDDER